MLKFRPNAPVHGGSIALLDCLFRHHSKLHSPLQGSLNLTLHKSQVSVHQGSPLMHESFPESSIRTGRVFGPVGQVFMHQGASLEHLRSLRPRAEQALKGRAPLGTTLSPTISGSTSTSIHSTRPWLSNPSIPLQLAMEWSGLTRWTKLIYFGRWCSILTTYPFAQYDAAL